VEAFSSLGVICLNDNNDTINALVNATNKYVMIGRNDFLALVAMDTLDKIVKKYQIYDSNAEQLINIIMNGPYISQVKSRARDVLINMVNF
jgi:hypothetical protein